MADKNHLNTVQPLSYLAFFFGCVLCTYTLKVSFNQSLRKTKIPVQFFFNDLNVGTSYFSFFLSRPALALLDWLLVWKGEKQLALIIGSSQFALLKLPNL